MSGPPPATASTGSGISVIAPIRWLTSGAGWVAAVMVVALILEIGAAAVFHQAFKLTTFDATGIVVFVSAASVGIERVIEAFWTVMGLFKGAMWPMTSVATHVDNLTETLRSATASYIDEASHIVTEVQGVAGASMQQASALAALLPTLQANLDRLASEAKDSQQLTSLTSAATGVLAQAQAQLNGFLGTAAGAGPAQREAVAKAIIRARALAAGKPAADAAAEADSWQAALPAGDPTAPARQAAVDKVLAADAATHVGSCLDVAGVAVANVSDFLGTFKDNPGRRLLSIGLGVVIGIGVTVGLGLDVFNAILVDNPGQGTIYGAVATGLVMGLGSSPTHEIIQTLQEYKKTQKAGHLAAAL